MTPLTPEERETGKENFYSAVSTFDQSPAAEKWKRRDFLKTVMGVGAAAATAGMTTGCHYFGYSPIGDPLRVAVIGTGDEGSVLIGAINPAYVNVVAICDIRPYNVHRAFQGDWSSDAGIAARPGLIAKYGYADEKAAKDKIQVETEYKKVLENPDVEAVIIALPLHLHAKVAVDAMLAGKHVLTEKLMAHNVAQCKVMGRVAAAHNKVLAVGHQRHYSVLYDNAVNMLKWGLLGELHHIRAQWHRGNLPGHDSWQQPLPVPVEAYIDGDKKMVNFVQDKRKDLESALKKEKDPLKARLLQKQVAQWLAWEEDAQIEAEKYGYENFNLGDGRTRTALEELCRWRLFKRTGGGLMAELGSHQLDAASIFCSALRADGKKAHPLSVHAVGGRHIFPLDRHAEDHVYCTFEFPGPGYEADFPGYFDPAMNYPDPKKGIPNYNDDPNKKIVVTYSSIMGNGWGGYGETVMGTKGTLILDREQEVLLFKDSDTSTKVGVKEDKGGPTLDTQASGKGPSLARAAAESGPVSRGYTEEIEHWAWCIRNQSSENQPRCRPEVALGDAVIALTCNVAIDNSINRKAGYIQFEEEWYDINSDETPDESNLKDENESLGAGLS
ncbi:MAG TPA: Gfo/Idh/MocA family oxidoreductase [Pirellulaceae bacterium]|nr:Gfo/Idh/MocA family oxidoreductase [Pirellulaceae bacterium]